MILNTKTTTNTDKSSSSQERLISLSPNLIFRTTPFHFVTYCSYCSFSNLFGLLYTLQREQLRIRPDPFRASVRVWLRETSGALSRYNIIGASLSEPAPCSAVLCLSVCRHTFGRKTFAVSIRIRALILHVSGDNLAASMRITRGILY